MAYKMMVKNEPLDVMKLFKPLVVSIILCWWYHLLTQARPTAAAAGAYWIFYPIFPIASAVTPTTSMRQATQISDKFEEVQQLVYRGLDVH